MKCPALSLVILTGCLIPEEATETTEIDQAAGRPCPDAGCGINGPEIDGGWFHELNLDGIQNSDGWALTGVRKGSATYTLNVVNGRMIANLRIGVAGSPSVLSGTGLINAQLRLKRDNQYMYTATIQDVQTSTVYWATEPGGTAIGERIETYQIVVTSDTTQWTGRLCSQPASNTSGRTAMPEFSTLVFEGERIDPVGKTIWDFDKRWINFGCEGSALAKLHLTGRTEAAKAATGFTTTIAERQMLLKMSLADYCGTGKPFTIRGQRLEWNDDRKTLWKQPNVSTSIEARWTQSGAACLNTPRLAANPSFESYAEFGSVNELNAAIEAECNRVNKPRPPPCWATSAGIQLVSHNPL